MTSWAMSDDPFHASQPRGSNTNGDFIQSNHQPQTYTMSRGLFTQPVAHSLPKRRLHGNFLLGHYGVGCGWIMREWHNLRKCEFQWSELHAQVLCCVWWDHCTSWVHISCCSAKGFGPDNVGLRRWQLEKQSMPAVIWLGFEAVAWLAWHLLDLRAKGTHLMVGWLGKTDHRCGHVRIENRNMYIHYVDRTSFFSGGDI